MNDEAKLIITPEEAESLLYDGRDEVHNFKSVGPMLIGCDYSRENALKAFREAIQIEIAGPGARGMNHALAVWSSKTDHSYFEADPEKVDAFDGAKAGGRP
jgi:hypothetical protein